MEFRVTWVIDLDAESLGDAAGLAREIQLDEKSLATHFVVKDESGDEREMWANSKQPARGKTQ